MRGSVHPGQLALCPTAPPPLGAVNSRKALAKAPDFPGRSRLLLQTAMPRWGHLRDKTWHIWGAKNSPSVWVPSQQLCWEVCSGKQKREGKTDNTLEPFSSETRSPTEGKKAKSSKLGN